MLNRFCLAVKPTPPPSLFLNGDNINKVDKKKYQPKSNEKCIPFLHCISSFEGNFSKNLKDAATTDLFYFWLFLLGVALAFTSADIIFQKFLELHSTLSEKQIFSTNFPFLTN